ncbi:unnamed protein product [Porites evermanni]|uniref:Reverse transcriptase domain-containing protein n=1 Tax=Porites evermanni TaxID=104178 RepID=A0ABN8M8X1_9CNID|nr:unnamed protein product [Porites evermanni]
MERCISDIRTWMLTDKLKLNDEKTEFMLIGTKQQLSQVNIDFLTVGSIDVAPYPSLKLKKTLGDRAFSSAAPNLWNNLPLHIRLEDNFERFKSLLKTHLFRLAFDT